MSGALGAPRYRPTSAPVGPPVTGLRGSIHADSAAGITFLAKMPSMVNARSVDLALERFYE